MKKTLLLLLLPFAAFAQNSKQAPVTVTCKFVNCANIDSLNIYTFEGAGYKVVGRAGMQPDSSYVFTVPSGKSRFYGIGQNEGSVARLILGEEPKVTIWGNCAMLNYSRTLGSPINKSYESAIKRFELFRTEENLMRNDLQKYRQNLNTADAENALARLKALDNNKRSYLDSLKATSSLMGKLGALAIQPIFEVSGKGKYASEGEFIGKEFFQYADLTDPIYNDLPEFGDAFRAYAIALHLSGAPAPLQKTWAAGQLAKLTPESKAARMAYGGIIAGFQSSSSPNYMEFAQQYVAQYKGKDNGEAARLEFEINRSRTYTPGMEAPDLVGETPEGTQFALSKLRGKVVLIDFWASWCGPCRREMPTVKANYEKYKSKGFEVFGVSLDRDKTQWINASQQEGITWPQISDLLGWQSKHAALYSVSSIPQTVLLDKDGKIIQRNLRGDELNKKLKEIFGE